MNALAQIKATQATISCSALFAAEQNYFSAMPAEEVTLHAVAPMRRKTK